MIGPESLLVCKRVFAIYFTDPADDNVESTVHILVRLLALLTGSKKKMRDSSDTRRSVDGVLSALGDSSETAKSVLQYLLDYVFYNSTSMTGYPSNHEPSLADFFADSRNAEMQDCQTEDDKDETVHTLSHAEDVKYTDGFAAKDCLENLPRTGSHG